MKPLPDDGNLEIPFGCLDCPFVSLKREEIMVARMRQRNLAFSLGEIECSVPSEQLLTMFRSNGVAEESIMLEWDIFRAKLLMGIRRALEVERDKTTCATSGIVRATKKCSGVRELEDIEFGGVRYLVVVCGSPQNEHLPDGVQDLVTVISRNEDQN